MNPEKDPTESSPLAEGTLSQTFHVLWMYITRPPAKIAFNTAANCRKYLVFTGASWSENEIPSNMTALVNLLTIYNIRQPIKKTRK